MTSSPATSADRAAALARLYGLHRHAELRDLARDHTQLDPGDGLAWQFLGAACRALGLADEALAAFVSAAALAPGDAQTHSNLGIAYRDAGQPGQAEHHYREALRLEPGAPEAHNNLGNLLLDTGRAEEAEACLRRALALRPDYAQAHSNHGNALLALGRHAEAQASFEQALRLKPDFAKAHGNLGNCFLEQGHLAEAEASYRRALQLQPAYAEAWCHLADCLAEAGRSAEAEHGYRQALLHKPGLLAARNNLGHLFNDLGRLAQAEQEFRAALAQEPGFMAARSNLLFALNYDPDRTAEAIFAEYLLFEQHVMGGLAAPAAPADPPLAALGAAPQTGLPARLPVADHTDPARRRLRIGYLSPDFRTHSCRFFLQPLLARHDRSAFEVLAYAELPRPDEQSAHYQALVDRWIPTHRLDDAALAERLRADGVDILVDLAGHTAGNRLGVLARKPAPVSASWLGYGSTTGLRAVDYFLTDTASAPPGSEHLFAEAPWRLPCAWVYRPGAGMGEPGPLPALHNGSVTFGTLTRALRVNHRTVRVWAEILRRVGQAQLVVDSASYRSAEACEVLAQAFAAHGIARHRLRIGHHSPPWDVLRSIDITLDCFPHNSGTTLFESLFLGVPFVTLAGRPSVGRLGSSILQALGRPEWIAATEQEYVEKVCALAADLPALAGERASLRQRMQASPLMDETGFARSLEAAYRDMLARLQNR